MAFLTQPLSLPHIAVDSFGYSTISGDWINVWLNSSNVQRKRGGIIVFDPDGVMKRVYSQKLRQDGYQVKCINTACLCTSVGYNPFVYAQSCANITKFVGAFISDTEGCEAPDCPSFVSAETTLLTALFAYVSFQAPRYEWNFSTVTEMLKTMLEARESLRYDNGSYHTNTVDYLFDLLKCNKPQCLAVRRYEEFKRMMGFNATMIIESCIARLKPFSNAIVDAYLSKDELDLKSFGTDDSRTVIFICAGKSETFDFLAPLLYTQLIDTLCFEIVSA